MNKIQAVIFDWAGTTIDYGCMAPVQAFKNAFAEVNIHLTEAEIRAPMGLSKRDHIAKILSNGEISGKWFDFYGRPWNEKDVEKIFSRFNEIILKTLHDYATPLPYVVETIEELRKLKIKIGSTTGYTSQMLEIVAKKAKNLGYFPDYSVTASDVKNLGRPYPYMIFENMKHFQTTSVKHVVKVGDTLADIAEGKNAGVWSVGVLEGSSLVGEIINEEKISFAIAEMKKAGADFVIRNMKELKDVITVIEREL